MTSHATVRPARRSSRRPAIRSRRLVITTATDPKPTIRSRRNHREQISGPRNQEELAMFAEQPRAGVRGFGRQRVPDALLKKDG
jgi:hypothetical protein